MNFNELVFIYALTERPAEVQKFKDIFKPEWLNDSVNRVLLEEIYRFYNTRGIAPSIDTLAEIVKDEYPDNFDFRFKGRFEELLRIEPDTSKTVYTLGKVRDVAIVRSLNELVNSREIVGAAENMDGASVLTTMNQWFNQFADIHDEESADLKEAINRLFKESVVREHNFRVPCGIKPIDDWTNNGLRASELGILIAPTGHGKSALLLNMAYKIAMKEQLPIWFVTNELTMSEQAERFLSRITASSLTMIQNDPLQAYDGMGSHWKMVDNIRVTSINRTVTAKDIEAMMLRWRNISGWMPKVIILDYMERLAPVEKGFSREKEWSWLGAIALDLVRLAKRHNVLIWSAAQTNRGGASANQITIEHAQGSIRHLQEAAVVVGAHQKDHPGTAHGRAMVFTPLKLRHSRMSSETVWLDIDLDMMNITSKILDAVENEPDEDDDDKVVSKPNIRKK